MKVTEYIKNAKDTLFSVEILPPQTGKSVESLWEALDPLMEFKPPFIDVTYHREEFIYKRRDGGYLEKIAIRKRPGTVGICAAIINRYKVEAVPHIICGGFSKSETENALIDLNYLGINNVLVIRGDARKAESGFTPEENGNDYAIDLLRQVINMNKGEYQDYELQNAVKTNFCPGVAGYPEKHFEAPNMKTDLNYLKQKIDAGAQYIVTQMFFRNESYFKFVESCRDAGIKVPIIPGLKPITTVNQVNVLPKTFHIDLPEDLVDAILKCKSNEEAKKVGVEWGIQQCKDLVKYGIPCLHFYSMGKSDSVRQIAQAVF